MKQHVCPIISNKPLSDSYHLLTAGWESVDTVPLPGQFLSLRANDATAPLLRRPFAISGYDSTKQAISFVYTRRGPATEILAGKRPGDTIDIIGPLGNVLPVPAEGERAIIVAGGTGLGPMVFWARYLKALAKPFSLIFGCRTASMVPLAGLFEGVDVTVCTDDGSHGFKGNTVEYLRQLTPALSGGVSMYACGPTPMLRACHQFAQERKVVCWVSLEQTMACGVGACMGCVVKVAGENPFARVCADGPVFESRTVIWE